jgi:predicted dehydrogenase
MDDVVRLASVGLGWWGGILASAAQRVAGAELVACFSRTDSTRAAFADAHACRAASSWDDLLADPEIDGVLIATPHSTHADLIVDSASAGKHVFVEKPFTLTVAEAKRAIAAAERAGIVLQVGHNRRRQPATRRLKELVDRGELGMIHHVEANLSHPKGLNPRTGWRAEVAESPAGGMTGLGVHMVDNLIYLAGRPARLAAFSKQILKVSKLDDATAMVLEFEDGPLGWLGTSMVIPDVARTAVFGTKAAAWNECDGERFFYQEVGEKDRTEMPVDTVDTIQDQLEDFARCISEQARPETSGAEALEVVAVLEGLMESVRTRDVVELDEVRSRT